MKLYLAREESGTLQLFRNKPTKFIFSYPWNRKHGWFPNNNGDDEGISMKIDSNLFPEVKWEDKEPTEVELVIKRK